MREIPSILSGDFVKPESGQGTYAQGAPADAKDPKAVVVGGGFSPDDFEQIRKTVDYVKVLPWFRADTSKPPGGAPGPPPPEKLAERITKSLDNEGRTGDDGYGVWTPGVYHF